MTIAQRLGRADLLELEAYQSASWQPGLVRLHANENPWRAVGDDSIEGLSRYPEPIPNAVRERLAALYGVVPAQLLATRGADEGIDLLTRSFLSAGRDAALICPPTFGMYAVATRIQGASLVSVPLQPAPSFELNVPAICSALAQSAIKLIFLCAPGNPTAVDLRTDDVERVLAAAHERALVVIDEAYVEFADRPSWTTRLHEYSHLVVLRTLSKAYSLAGARVGSVIADPSIISLLGKLIPPYSMATGTIEATLRALDSAALPIATARIDLLVTERTRLAGALTALADVESVGRSSANFLYTTLRNPAAFLERAARGGFLLRDYTNGPFTPRAVRITVADPATNDRLIEALTTP
jgi:histidinol-phosphate/aromatic aminotransferase/cobyric acid decarboxylase-like protein